ncbi:flagellar basal body-associated FliL family protein, partial [Desulfovibrio sp.]|uniref:flagellar basal body-associated FliL family protein n=1 Tax=Desulfovibrio sp. TaxID=885 RepID=UPI0023C8BC85
PSAPAAQSSPDIVKEFAPFVVPTQEAQGGTRFLVCKFSAIIKDPALSREIDQRMLSLRDAIYFYLRSKDDAFLRDARNGQQIKSDLLGVLNDYMAQGKIEDILFESYLNQ